MTTYTFKPTGDDNVYTVEGLEDACLKGQSHVAIFNADARHEDIISDIVSNNHKVIDDDIFTFPDGKSYKMSNRLPAPFETPKPEEKPADPAPTCSGSCGGTCAGGCGTPPTASTRGPVQAVPVVAFDSFGKVFNGSVSIAWPGATSSEVILEFDKVSKATSPGDITNTIQVPGQSGRIILVSYNDGKVQVMVQLG
jgi:hypothetical protein